MAFKLIVLAAVLAIVKAGLLPATAPAAISYSAAPAVSHISYSSPIVSYGTPLATQIATPAITSQSQNIIRSFGNLGQISTYSKTIDTPFSSVQKADVRISNPGLRIATAPAAIAAAPAAIGVAYSAAPAVSHVTYTGLGANYGW